MQIVNLTPHDLTLYTWEDVIQVEGGYRVRMGGAPRVIESSGQLARVDEYLEVLSPLVVDGIETSLARKRFLGVLGVPEPRTNVLLVVSSLVAERLRGRSDIWVPGPLVRDGAGRPVGAVGLSQIE